MSIRRTSEPLVDIGDHPAYRRPMEQDARVSIAALRSGHARLAAFVAGASTDDLTAPSMCTEWNVAQVLSHLGSGAEIALGTVTGTQVDNEEVWSRWNALAP